MLPSAAARRLLFRTPSGDGRRRHRCGGALHPPIFETYGHQLVHLGGVGSGQVAKLLNNLLFTANIANAKSALNLGEALGVDVSNLTES